MRRLDRGELRRTRDLVAGSIVRGQPDRGSDLDVHVVHREPWRQRVQRFAGAVPCEIFINPLARLRGYFAVEQANGRPCTCSPPAGVVDRDGDLAALRAEAEAWLARPPTTDDQGLLRKRYEAADLVEDALDVVGRDPCAAACIAAIATERILAYWLLAQRHLMPRRKDLLRSVAALDAAVGDVAVRAFGDGPAAERVAATAELADRCLRVRGFFAWESAREPC